MLNKKSISISLLVLILFSMIMSLSTVSFATDKVIRPAGETYNSYKGEGYNVDIPEVSIDEASTWVERKGFELVGFLQKFVQPFAIIIFIGCSILTLLGAFGNGRLVSRGLLGMFISVIMYVVALYAPEIMDVFLGWVMS